MSLKALLRLFEGHARQAPGSEASTREALRRLPFASQPRRIIDLGCGTGASTLVLASQLRAPVVAVDRLQPFLDQLERDAKARGLDALIETRCADFGALTEPEGSFDLLWSEGAIYWLGFEEGLKRWRPLLAPGGLAAVSEASWLVEDPAPEPAAFWREAYPSMGTVAENRRRAENAGFEVLDTFTLPASDWWDYYRPLEARIEALRAEAAHDAELAGAIAETERELALYRTHGDAYGYIFHLLRRA